MEKTIVKFISKSYFMHKDLLLIIWSVNKVKKHLSSSTLYAD